MVECQIIQDGKIRDQVIQKNWWNESTKGNPIGLRLITDIG